MGIEHYIEIGFFNMANHTSKISKTLQEGQEQEELMFFLSRQNDLGNSRVFAVGKILNDQELASTQFNIDSVSSVELLEEIDLAKDETIKEICSEINDIGTSIAKEQDVIKKLRVNSSHNLSRLDKSISKL